MKIQFCGAAAGVTGSCHLLTCGTHKILLDCGQFQGSKQEEALNYEEFPFDPAEVEAVILSHAHIDHCGRLPVLVKKGFKGKLGGLAKKALPSVVKFMSKKLSGKKK